MKYVQSILIGVFLIYVANSMYMMAMLFRKMTCTTPPCCTSYLADKPKLQMALFTSVDQLTTRRDYKLIATFKNFNYMEPFEKEILIDLPLKTRQNGTLFLGVLVIADDGKPITEKVIFSGDKNIHRMRLTEYVVPQGTAFNLLGKNENNKKPKGIKPVTHFQPNANIVILTDIISMGFNEIPPELWRVLFVNSDNKFLPVVQTDFFRTRMKDLIQVTRDTTEMTLKINYSPISIGLLRLMLQIEHTTKSMENLGFSKKDIDEVKGIFSDTNVYLLCGTVFVGCVHLLFDFLSFKNDVLFWKRKKNYTGLSMRTILWRAFSQIIIFLYLLDDKASFLVLIPVGIGALIEIWKCKKILKIGFSFRSGFSRIQEDETNQIVKSEKITQEFDREAMRYLSYFLYPLCICGAVFSLIYMPHKSWYSWTLNSLVNGVYAFGFLFMLPQLFVNYKLKSVAALPWRAFMYKAFNTFIDDIFAFIITMPTAHRVACFRDDVVFLIYLYQRWLYPVDKSRIDCGVAFEDDNSSHTTNDKLKIKENHNSIDDKKTK